MDDLQERVLERIRKGEVSMRPRRYFILRAIGASVVALLALACSVFALSFVIFAIHESGEQFLLGFGTRGLVTFVTLFPWLSLVVSVLLLIALEVLLRTFRFGYRLPLLGIFFWILAAAVAGSVIVNLTPLHSFLLERADQDQLPVLGPLYEQLHDPHEPQGVYRGTITAIDATEFVISYDDGDRDPDDGSWTVVPPAGFATSTLVIGSRAYVAGVLMHGIVYAYGIQILQEEQ
ncbi:MAG: hypothetical protein ACREGR_04210 [Minisyncoccia bacterium]